MAWYSFGITNASGLSNPTNVGDTVSAAGAWINGTRLSRDIQLNSLSGIVFDIESCINLGNIGNTQYDPQTMLQNYAVATAYSNLTDGFTHSSQYPYIPLVSMNLVLCDKNPVNIADLAELNSHIVIITQPFTGVSNDSLVISSDSTVAGRGYQDLYISGSGQNNVFPDTIDESGSIVSYCRFPGFAALVDVNTVNTYLANDYLYPGITYTVSKLRYTQQGQYISNYTYAYGYINNPNLGQAAEMSVSFSGINVQRYGTWKNINKASVQIGDSWKSVQDISVLKNGSWYTLPKTSSMIFI